MAYNAVAMKGAATHTKKKKTEWPEALKLYVGRAFEHVDDSNRPALESYLKTMITQAFESNSVWTTEWSTEPLPDLSTKALPFEKKWELMQPPSPPVSSAVASKGAVATKRRSRFDVATAVSPGATLDTDAQKAKRARRFENSPAKTTSPAPEVPGLVGFSEGVPDYDEHTIIGHATKLEKSYLRLTSAPDPGTVRPLHVLRETLQLLKNKWKESANYAYICDQFKSLRQDLTVQRIKNDFTITVYEIHARIALEKFDLGEYNQCQTQLQALYSQVPGAGHPLEFLAYRILYMLHTRNLTEINTVLVNLTPAQRSDANIAHALAVRKSMACSNYPKLFRLYLEAPNMSGYLMDNFIDRERISALATVCKVYKPTLLLDQMSAKVLGFVDAEELKEFLTALDDDTLTSSIEPASAMIGAAQSYSLNTKTASTFFEMKKAAMNRVDIKGQI